MITNSVTIAEPITLNGAGVGGDGALVKTGENSATLSGAITLASNTTIFVDRPLTISGAISGAGGIVKTGFNSLTLTNGGNSYAGATTINAGSVVVTANGALGTVAGNTVVNASGTLELNVTGGNYSTAEPLAINGGQLTTNITHSFAGPIALTGTATVVSSGALTLSGAISGTGSISKTANNSLTLTNASNSFTGGITVLFGLLSIGSDAHLGGAASGVTLNGETSSRL